MSDGSQPGTPGGGVRSIALGALAALGLVIAAILVWNSVAPQPESQMAGDVTEAETEAPVEPTQSVAEVVSPEPQVPAPEPQDPVQAAEGAATATEAPPVAEEVTEATPEADDVPVPEVETTAEAAPAPEKDTRVDTTLPATVDVPVEPAQGGTTEVATLEATPELQPSTEPEAEPVPDVAQDPAPKPDVVDRGEDLAPPRFDLVRIDASGGAVVAGQAEPGGLVRVLLDGNAVAETVADGRGSFVALFSVRPSSEARALTLEAEDTAGLRVASLETALVSPFEATLPTPEVTEPAPAPEGTADVPQSEPTLRADGLPNVAGSLDDPVIPDAEPPVRETAALTEDAELPSAPPSPQATQDLPTTDAPATPTTSAPQTPAVPAAPSVVIVSRDGARPVLPDAQPDRPDGDGLGNVVIDTISYDTEGEVVLVGRAQPGLSVRIYLDNQSVETASAGTDGVWRSRVLGIAQGVYTLRVDELDAAGTVLSRFETPFQRAVRADAVLAAQAAEARASAARGEETAFRDHAPGARAVAGIVTVQPGFTLWRIAQDNYGDGVQYVRVFNSNRGRIRDPDLIYPGQVFTVPSD